MANNRVLVQYPPEVIAEIDRIAGVGRRTPYLVDLAKREVKLYRQREALLAATGSWKPEYHPELAQGAAAYVRQLRDLDRERTDRIETHRREE